MTIRKWIRVLGTAATALVMLAGLAMAPTTQAQSDKKQNEKKKKKGDPPRINNDSANPIVPMTDEQTIDYLLSEYMGAWQIGDTEHMHKLYADDVAVVNGGWSPPIVGWTNYLSAYKQQRSHMEKVRLDRMNTYLKINGTTAWTTYEWEFEAIVDGNPTLARGHTTFVLVKRDNRWLIQHDHTSVVQSNKAKQPAEAPSNTPSAPAGQPPKPSSR